MKSHKETTFTVIIELDKHETEILRAMIQNPPVYGEEPPDVSTFRARLFEHLSAHLSN